MSFATEEQTQQQKFDQGVAIARRDGHMTPTLQSRVAREATDKQLNQLVEVLVVDLKMGPEELIDEVKFGRMPFVAIEYARYTKEMNAKLQGEAAKFATDKELHQLLRFLMFELRLSPAMIIGKIKSGRRREVLDYLRERDGLPLVEKVVLNPCPIEAYNPSMHDLIRSMRAPEPQLA
jgi:predicted house-cleaning noncanonical NTP pyrophosphatase (MazG superfamily)